MLVAEHVLVPTWHLLAWVLLDDAALYQECEGSEDGGGGDSVALLPKTGMDIVGLEVPVEGHHLVQYREALIRHP